MKLRLIAAATLVSLGIGAYGALPYTALNLPAGSHHPVLSPDGSKLLFSTDNHTGLSSLDFESGDIVVLDESASAGFQPVFSTDGNTVFYRTAEMRDGLLYRDARSFNFNEGKTRRLAAPSRDKIELESLAKTDFAIADYRELKVRKNGIERRIDPIADSHSYLWASLSADGERVLFTEPFKGVFVADTDGNNPRCLISKGDYAAWAGPNTVVVVVTHDDGYVVTDSRLVAINTITGEIETLTDPDMIVGEATAGNDGTVVFTDIEGKMFIFNINDR